MNWAAFPEECETDMGWPQWKKEWEHGRKKSQPTVHVPLCKGIKSLPPLMLIFLQGTSSFFLLLFMFLFTCNNAGRKGAVETLQPEKGTCFTQFGVKQPKERILHCISLLLLQPYLLHLVLLLRLPSGLINLLALLLNIPFWDKIEDLLSCFCFSCWILPGCLHRHCLPASAESSTWREVFK